MRRTATGRKAAALTVGAVWLAVLGAGSPAAGAGPDETGWWSRTSTGPLLPIGLPTGVPDGGLYVAGDPDGRSGVSALRFALGEGETATTLQLAVESTVGVPAVLVCRTAIGWSGQQGGPLSDAPLDACEEGAVEATLSEDGQTLLADVGGLGEPGSLDVMLVPEEPSAFRLVLAPPDEDALTTTTQSDPGPLPGGESTADEGGFDGGLAEPPPLDDGFSAGPPLDGAAELPPLDPVDPLLAGELPALPEDLVAAPAPRTAAPPQGLRPVVAPVLVGGTDRVQVLFALLFADVLLAWWWLLRKEPRAPRSLLALTRGAAPEPAPAPLRGIGRFARARTGPAVGV